MLWQTTAFLFLGRNPKECTLSRSPSISKLTSDPPKNRRPTTFRCCRNTSPFRLSVASDFPGREGPCVLRQSVGRGFGPFARPSSDYIEDTVQTIGQAVTEMYRPTLTQIDTVISESLERRGVEAKKQEEKPLRRRLC